jgi:hypothetical protein
VVGQAGVLAGHERMAPGTAIGPLIVSLFIVFLGFVVVTDHKGIATRSVEPSPRPRLAARLDQWLRIDPEAMARLSRRVQLIGGWAFLLCGSLGVTIVVLNLITGWPPRHPPMSNISPQPNPGSAHPGRRPHVVETQG